MFVMWAVLEKFTRVWGLDKFMMEGQTNGLCSWQRVTFDICLEKWENRLVIFLQGAVEQLIDNILANNRYRCRVKDVIPGEEEVNQHCVLVMYVLFIKEVNED